MAKGNKQRRKPLLKQQAATSPLSDTVFDQAQPAAPVLSGAALEAAWAAKQNLVSLERYCETRELLRTERSNLEGLAEARAQLAECRQKARLLADARPPVTVHPLGSFPLLGGTWDFLELTTRIDALLPVAETGAPGNGSLCRALALQLAESEMARFTSTAACLGRTETERLLGSALTQADLDNLRHRQAFVRLLDQVAALGSASFFNALVSAFWPQQGQAITSVCLSTCASRVVRGPDKAGDVGLAIGGERKQDQRQDTDEFVLAGFADRASGLPVFLQEPAILPPDAKKSARSALLVTMLEQAGPTLREMYPQVRHVVVDSALCTAKFIQAARRAGLQVVSKLSAAQVAKYLDTHAPDPAAFVDLAGRDGSLRAQWCRDLSIGKEAVRGLLVEDRTRGGTKRGSGSSIVVSTDTGHDWTMEDLWQTAEGPAEGSARAGSVWALFKDKSVWVDGDFVATPARQKALLSLLALFALLLKITGERARDALARHNLLFPMHKGAGTPGPTLQHMIAYTKSRNMAVFRQGGQVIHVKADPRIRDVLAAMGEPWLRFLETGQPH